MPAPIAAAATTTRSVTFDFGKSASTGTAGDALAFASKLLDARQKLPSKSAPEADERDAGAVDDIRQTERSDRTSRADEVTSSDESSDVEDDRAAEAAGEAEDSRDEPDSSDDAAAAMLAALAALAGDQAKPVDAEGVVADEATATGGAIAGVATAAAAIIGATADATGELAGDPEQAAAATSDAHTAQVASKDGSSKLDAALKQMEPTDDASLTLTPDAVQSKADADGGDRQPTDGEAQSDAQADSAADAAFAAGVAKPDDKASPFRELMDKLATTAEPTAAPQPAAEAKPAPAAAPIAPPVRPEHQFARDNVDRVVSSVQSQAAAGNNGSMRVRLDPPELGALDVALKMVEGKMTASFTTSNDQATQLLSHSLNQLKGALETAGIQVDRLEVRQAAPTSASSDRDSTGQQQQSDRGSASSQQQGEQQRKQMVDRMWRKYAYGSDAVDLVA